MTEGLYRRHFLGMVGTGATIAIAGCNQGTTEQSPATNDSSDTATNTESLQAHFAQDSVRTGNQATLTVNSGADSAVVISSRQLSQSQLQGMIEGEWIESGIQLSVPSNNEIPVSVTEAFRCQPGTYTFNVTGVQTGTSDEAKLDVQRVPQPSTFTQSAYSLEGGSPATVEIQLHCVDTIGLRITTGEDSDQPVLDATLKATEGEDTISLQVRRGADPANLLSANSGTIHEQTISPDYLPLNGSYKLSLLEGDSIEDVASLSALENQN